MSCHDVNLCGYLGGGGGGNNPCGPAEIFPFLNIMEKSVSAIPVSHN